MERCANIGIGFVNLHLNHPILSQMHICRLNIFMEKASIHLVLQGHTDLYENTQKFLFTHVISLLTLGVFVCHLLNLLAKSRAFDVVSHDVQLSFLGFLHFDKSYNVWMTLSLLQFLGFLEHVHPCFL